MQTWILSVRPAHETGLPSVDVAVRAKSDATVADLARSLGQHLAPDQRSLLLVPNDGGQLWPAGRPLSECGLRTGDLVDVGPAPGSWRDRPAGTSGARAVLRVTEGPDRGARVRVGAGQATIGRAVGCTLRLSDPQVSLRHARIELGARPVVHDEGSANGTSIGGAPAAASPVDWGTEIRLGGTAVVIDAGDVSDQDLPVSVYRPPRFGDPLRDDKVDIPAPPSRNRPTPFPWAILALPMVMGAAMFMRMHTAYALVYMLAWPIIGALGYWQQRRAAEKNFQEELADWRVDLEEMLDTLDENNLRQRERMLDDFPDEETLRARAAARDPYLWARAEDRSAFLTTRFGTGPVPAMLGAEVRDGGDRAERRKAVAEVNERAVLEELPVLADLTQHTVVAITGKEDEVDALTRAVLLRIGFDHSPSEVSIAACLGRRRRHHEAWLRWLPHTSARLGGEPPVAVGARASTALLEHLVSEGDGIGHTICLVDEEAGVPRRTVEAVAQAAAGRGVHLVWLGQQASEVPAATGLLVDIDAGMLGVRDRMGTARIEVPDGASLDHAWRHARSVTAYVDEAAVLPPSTAIPSIVRLPEVSSDLEDLDAPENVVRRWRQAGGLRAQIGRGVDGTVTIDLREDGPHGLVAGTTGSGKSELLQSLICSLALNNPPERITFLLVDYKGGAAFRECADLPHTVGYITDLTPALVSRALTSLGAEITKREELLGKYEVKDLIQLEREHPEAAPPSLLICVDEFAALTKEVPEFVDGMVNLAQRGRSLGMHLLLATQRPAGVVYRPDPRQHRPADRAARLLARRLARRHGLPRGRPHLPPYAGPRVGPAHRPRHRGARAVGLDRRPRPAGRRRGRGRGAAVRGHHLQRARPARRRRRGRRRPPRPAHRPGALRAQHPGGVRPQREDPAAPALAAVAAVGAAAQGGRAGPGRQRARPGTAPAGAARRPRAAGPAGLGRGPLRDRPPARARRLRLRQDRAAADRGAGRLGRRRGRGRRRGAVHLRAGLRRRRAHPHRPAARPWPRSCPRASPAG